MKIIKPIRDYNSYSSPIAKAIFAQLDELIYAPLLATLRSNDIQNANESALVSALRRGVIEYCDGYFTGPLTASISRELRSYGARYNVVRKVYYLEISQMPQLILQAIAAGKQASQETMKKINSILFAMEGKEVKSPNIAPFFDETLEKLSRQFYTTTRPLTGEDLEVNMRPQLMDQLKEAYTKNLDKYIKGWYDEAILRLRSKVEENAEAGFRAERLIDIVKGERGVSQRKATFLARQETSLLTASYREIRYKDIGIESYMWSTSHDERVRHDHAILNGHIFRFDDPPVTNQRTNAENNPGQDFGCRCTAIPVLSHGINMIDEEPISTQKILEEAK